MADTVVAAIFRPNDSHVGRWSGENRTSPGESCPRRDAAPVAEGDRVAVWAWPMVSDGHVRPTTLLSFNCETGSPGG
jgi:hypothetical protein